MQYDSDRDQTQHARRDAGQPVQWETERAFRATEPTFERPALSETRGGLRPAAPRTAAKEQAMEVVGVGVIAAAAGHLLAEAHPRGGVHRMAEEPSTAAEVAALDQIVDPQRRIRDLRQSEALAQQRSEPVQVSDVAATASVPANLPAAPTPSQVAHAHRLENPAAARIPVMRAPVGRTEESLSTPTIGVESPDLV